MRKFIRITILFIAIAVSTQTQAQTQKNKYGLKVVSDIEEYNLQVKNNPSLELVDLEKVIPNIKLEIAYATKNNFTHEVIYKSARAFFRKDAAKALTQVQKELNKKGLGLKIFDAYRPYSATVRFYEVYPDKEFVADPKTGSIHNRGCAVDLTIIDLNTGKEIAMPTPFDSFSEKASHNYMELSEEVLKNRTLLKTVMEKYGFNIYVSEWWHYSFNKWKDYDIMDIPFEKLSATN